MKDRVLTAEEKLSLVQLIGISNTVEDLKKNMGSYLKNNIFTDKKVDTTSEIPPKEASVEDKPLIIESTIEDTDIKDASIYDSKYLDIVKEDLTKEKEKNPDSRKTEIVSDTEIDKVEETPDEEPAEETVEEPKDSGFLTEEEIYNNNDKFVESLQKSQVLEKKINPWEGLRTVTPGDKI